MFSSERLPAIRRLPLSRSPAPAVSAKEPLMPAIWPATLTAAQANYTITLDATFKNTLPIRPLSRLGNFDGLGADDLALSARGRGAGSIFIIQGSSSFASLPFVNGTNTIEIDGPGAAGDMFGFATIGIESFYSGAGPTLLTSAVIPSTVF